MLDVACPQSGIHVLGRRRNDVVNRVDARVRREELVREHAGALSEGELIGYRAMHVGTMLQGAARNLLPYATAERNVR